MRCPQTALVAVTVLAGLTATACQRASHPVAQTAPPLVLAPTAIKSDPAYIAKARADSARLPYTAADIHFMSGMISHHAQAIKMAQWAPTHDASASVRTLAARIINAQTDEIVLMQHWLADRQQRVPEPDPRGMKMVLNGMQHDMLMPGMLTDDQLKQLDEARGTQFDRLFLTFMIQHHKGAVTMVQELFASNGAGQDEMVFKFASDVNVDQSTEIARMQRMLLVLPPASRSP